MKVKLEARGYWDVMDETDDCQDNRLATEAILPAVPPKMIHMLTVKKIAKEAWDAIKGFHVGSDRAKGDGAKVALGMELLAPRDGEHINSLESDCQCHLLNHEVCSVQ